MATKKEGRPRRSGYVKGFTLDQTFQNLKKTMPKKHGGAQGDSESAGRCASISFQGVRQSHTSGESDGVEVPDVANQDDTSKKLKANKKLWKILLATVHSCAELVFMPNCRPRRTRQGYSDRLASRCHPLLSGDGSTCAGGCLDRKPRAEACPHGGSKPSLANNRAHVDYLHQEI